MDQAQREEIGTLIRLIATLLIRTCFTACLVGVAGLVAVNLLEGGTATWPAGFALTGALGGLGIGGIYALLRRLLPGFLL